jgi:hypothetical protein
MSSSILGAPRGGAHPPLRSPLDSCASSSPFFLGAGAAAAHTPDPGYTDPFGDTADAPKVRLKQDVYRMTRRGVLRVPVTCPESAEVRCRGRLGVRARGRRVGLQRFSIARGDTSVTRVTLARSARRLVRRQKRVRMRLTAVTRRGEDRTATRRRILVKAPA